MDGSISDIDHGATSAPRTQMLMITKVVINNVTSDPQHILEAIYSQRIPIGLYTTVTVGRLESRTESKPVLARTGEIHWDDKTILPADLSSKVCIDIYASFELAAVLGRGELLQRFQTTVGDMLERSAQSPSIVFPSISEQNNPIICYSSLTLETEYLHEDDSQTLQSSGITEKCDPMVDAVDAHVLAQMTDVGHDALLRYNQSQQGKYLLDMAEQFETVLEFCPIDHPCRTAATFNLATAKFINSRVHGMAVELDDAILLYREALGLHPMDSPDRVNTLFHLAITLLSRSDAQRIVSDVQEAEDIISVILETTLIDSLPHKMASLVIENYALSDYRDQPDHLLRKLEDVLKRCLDGNIGRLDELVTCYENARLVHVNQLQYPRLIGNLGVALNARFDRDGNEQDLNDAVSRLRESVSLSPERPMTLSNLSGILTIRFQRQGDLKDLDEAISHSKNALEYQPDGVAILLQLVKVLGLRFEHQENDQDLDEAILHGFQIIPTPFHLSRHIAFGVKHAARLRVRYASRDDRPDLENCIAILRFAVNLMPTTHASRSDALAVLTMALKMRFEKFGDKKNLDTAIVCCREALKLMTVDHALHSDSLCLLASLLDDRFEHDSSVQDLTEAMALYREDLSFHPEKETKLLCKIADAQYRRYLHTGDKQDLDDAILQLRMCMAQPSTDDDANKNVRFTLAAALIRHHDDWDPSLQTIDEAILLYRQCLELFSMDMDGANYAGCMNNLAATLNSRYRQQRCKETLEEVIMLYRKILTSFQVTGPRRAKALSNLGNALENLKNEEFRDEIISLHKEALELQPDGDPYRSVVLCHLAQAHLNRYYSQQDKQDLDDADQYARRSLALYHTDAVERPSPLFYLAKIACEYFEYAQKYGIEKDDNPSKYLDIAMNHFKDAVALRSSGPIWRLKASGFWINQAEKYNHDSALEAYACCFQVLDTHLAATASIPSRHDFVQHLPHMIDAASCALRRGNVCRALELMEQGRTLVWTQISRYRTPIDDLLQHGEHPRELATRFQKLSSLLDNPHEADGGMYKEEKASRYERIVHDWSAVVEGIRRLDGLGRFLLPPLFSNLREAACDGPVIVFVASQYSCHAVVVLHRQPPLHIPLLTDCQQLAGLAECFQDIVHRTRDNVEGLLREVLQQLWDTVVAPVADELQKFAKKHSRIWLCPTSILTLLPLHAAGEYLRPRGRFLSQLYISSYTPSLSALIKARSHRHQQTTKRFTAIGQAQPAGYDLPLLLVEQELELVESLVPKDTIEFTKFTSAASTREASLRALQQSEWIHLACHGLQRFDEPYNSSFLMLDEPLTLFDISRTNLENHEFAFLSACETALGDKRAPDEVIHLAAGLQFAGVKSVIATMWEVEDATVGYLVQSFYKNMFADGVADCTNAAGSLHKALRSSAAKKMSLAQRIVFIHIGL